MKTSIFNAADTVRLLIWDCGSVNASHRVSEWHTDSKRFIETANVTSRSVNASHRVGECPTAAAGYRGVSRRCQELPEQPRPDGQIKTDKLQMRGLLLLLSWQIPARFVYVFVSAYPRQQQNFAHFLSLSVEMIYPGVKVAWKQGRGRGGGGWWRWRG